MLWNLCSLYSPALKKSGRKSYLKKIKKLKNNTLLELDTLETIDDVVMFDYKVGYPEKLAF